MTSINPTPTIKTRICIISDTHTTAPYPSTFKTFAYRSPLPTCDILLHAGDITKAGRVNEYEPMLAMLKAAPADLKLVIAGNHDISLDEEFYRRRMKGVHGHEELGRVREMWMGEEARKKGIVYLEEGVREFELENGARFTIYTSPYQPEFCGWAFAYKRSEDRFNPSPADSKSKAANPVPDYPNIDIMLTHGPPMGILDETNRGQNVGCEHLRRADQRCRPLLHCFGHIHEGWGAGRMNWADEKFEQIEINESRVVKDRAAHVYASKGDGNALKRGQETLFVNAAIMDQRYHPTNAPWVVDLDLPVSEKLG